MIIFVFINAPSDVLMVFGMKRLHGFCGLKSKCYVFRNQTPIEFQSIRLGFIQIILHVSFDASVSRKDLIS